MAETKKPETKAPETKAPESAKAETPKQSQPATGAGEYVVIADQIVVVDGDSHAVAKRGTKVSLGAKQARTLSGGTRPAVVAAASVKDEDVDAAARGALREAASRRASSKSKG